MPLDATLPMTPDKKTTSESHGGSSTRGSHRLASAQACERLWALRTVYGIVTTNDPPWRLVGTLIHTCLAYHYAAQMNPAPAWFHKKHLLDALQEDGVGKPEVVKLACDVYEAYKQRFAGDTWRPVAVEEEFVATIGELDPGGEDSSLDNEIVSCRVDLLIESNGDLWIVDHKATAGSSWGSDRLEAWKDDGEYSLNWQVMLNLHVLRSPRNQAKLGGRSVRGFIIQRIKRKTPFDFDRHVLQVPSRAYAQAPRMARELCRREREIMARIRRGEQPVPNFSACYGRYGPCDYRDLCAADSDEVQRVVLETQYRSTRAGASRTGDPSIVQIGPAPSGTVLAGPGGLTNGGGTAP